MIANDRELVATVDRIRSLQEQAARLRTVEPDPESFRLSVSGFLAEVDRMQLEVREYLSVHPTEEPDRLMSAGDWCSCDAVELSPNRVSGAWVFKGRRVPVTALFQNIADGARIACGFRVLLIRISTSHPRAARNDINCPPVSASASGL